MNCIIITEQHSSFGNTAKMQTEYHQSAFCVEARTVMDIDRSLLN